MPVRPLILAENAGLFFRAGRLRRAAVIVRRTAEKFLADRNPSGRPNTDVLRPLADPARPARNGARWLIDFPAGMTADEAALYVQPFRHLTRSVGSRRGAWWLASAIDIELRSRLARHERFLAAAFGPKPDFQWIDSRSAAGPGTIIVARDDDFARGMLRSKFFQAWWRRYASPRQPLFALRSFPFPRDPRLTFSQLNSTQQAHRAQIGQGDRTDNVLACDAAVAASYEFPNDLAENEIVLRLLALNRHRPSGPG